MSRDWLALDVGGAHLKAAHSRASSRTLAFEVWRKPDELASAIARLLSFFPPFDAVALTMTAELCDCYATKSDGVRSILAAVELAVTPRSIIVWGTDGSFHSAVEIHDRPLLAAAANWLALATVAASMVSADQAILIDVGSTTTDLIPLSKGVVVVQARTDTERLRTGELVYAGVRRTPVCALATELPLGPGEPIGLAAELFATTLDVFLILGDLAPDPNDFSTADNRPATIERSVERLSRMIGGDRDSLSTSDIKDLAEAAQRCLLNRLIRSARRVCEATLTRIDSAIVSGSGEFLAGRVAREILGPDFPVHSLKNLWGEAASTAACAHAILTLAERHPRGPTETP